MSNPAIYKGFFSPYTPKQDCDHVWGRQLECVKCRAPRPAKPTPVTMADVQIHLAESAEPAQLLPDCECGHLCIAHDEEVGKCSGGRNGCGCLRYTPKAAEPAQEEPTINRYVQGFWFSPLACTMICRRCGAWVDPTFIAEHDEFHASVAPSQPKPAIETGKSPENPSTCEMAESSAVIRRMQPDLYFVDWGRVHFGCTLDGLSRLGNDLALYVKRERRIG